MENNNTCLQCGKHTQWIKREHAPCFTETNNENGREVDQEWRRHRFKPYSAKELEQQEADEEAYIKQMGEMAEWFRNEEGGSWI